MRTDAPIGYCVAKLAALPKMAASDREFFWGILGFYTKWFTGSCRIGWAITMQNNSKNGKLSHLTMNTERIEELLQELIYKQDDIIVRLEIMESTIEKNLSDSNYKLDQIREELNWWEGKPTLAKMLLSALEGIDGSLSDIDLSISALDR